MYDHFYNLTGRPFQLTPDPQFYFESATHRKALSYLGYGLAQGEGFIVITGEVGAGKSTLVSHLMQSVDKIRLTAANIVTSQLDGLDMVRMTAESFGIDTRGLDKAATLKSIENFLHAEARAGRRCLLVVDEAQNLSIDALEELRMLSNFQLGSSALLQVFLLGQPEFRDLVRDAPELEQLRQRVIATHHLEAMEASEVEPYIVHRLTCAGWNGRPEITADAYSALYTETGGVPRKLNTLMNRVMLMGAVEQVDKLDCDMVVAVIADMAGKSFEYEASMSTVAPVEDKFQKPVEQEKMPDAVAATAVESSESRVKVLTQKVATEAVVTPISNAEIQALASRVALMEQRVTEQEAALRRVLSMMIEWMDRESNLESRFIQNNRAA